MKKKKKKKIVLRLFSHYKNEARKGQIRHTYKLGVVHKLVEI